MIFRFLIMNYLPLLIIWTSVIYKSCGFDGIYAEHLKFGSYLLADVLSQCLSSFFTHGTLPDSLIANVTCPCD